MRLHRLHWADLSRRCTHRWEDEWHTRQHHQVLRPRRQRRNRLFEQLICGLVCGSDEQPGSMSVSGWRVGC